MVQSIKQAAGHDPQAPRLPILSLSLIELMVLRVSFAGCSNVIIRTLLGILIASCSTIFVIVVKNLNEFNIMIKKSDKK